MRLSHCRTEPPHPLVPENEVLIQQAVSTLIKDKTIVVTARRLRTVTGADKIIVIDKAALRKRKRPESFRIPADNNAERHKKVGVLISNWTFQKRSGIKKTRNTFLASGIFDAGSRNFNRNRQGFEFLIKT